MLIKVMLIKKKTCNTEKVNIATEFFIFELA